VYRAGFVDLGLEVLLPHLAGARVERVEVTADCLLVDAEPRGMDAACRHCSSPARLADVTLGVRKVVIQVRVRRFFCENVTCQARTFVEQVDGLTARHARRSPPLRRMLEAIGLALCARAGARLAAKLGVVVSRSGLLRLLRAMPDPVVLPTRVLGVDDFALKRGHVYGTVIIDCDSHQVLDVLPGRDAEPLAEWLTTHPGAEIVCRDRSSAYAEGVRTAAPGAVQVADRFHLLQNLHTAVERCVARHKACLRTPVPSPEEPGEEPPTQQPAELEPAGRLAERRRYHHGLVHELLGQGLSIRRIAEHLGWGRHTVQRYARAENWQEMVTGRRRPPASCLDPYKDHLRTNYAGQRGNIQALHREITSQGFTGSYSTVRDFLRSSYPAAEQPKLAPRPPSVRQVTGWICHKPASLTDTDTAALTEILDHCPQLRAAHDLVRGFADMLTQRRGTTELTGWIHTATTANLPGISTFAQHLTNDIEAVTAGLSLPWSSGPVEGTVNRIKMLKRQMYGRANFDLLRKRILLALARRMRIGDRRPDPASFVDAQHAAHMGQAWPECWRLRVAYGHRRGSHQPGHQ
jgi:transposase